MTMLAAALLGGCLDGDDLRSRTAAAGPGCAVTLAGTWGGTARTFSTSTGEAIATVSWTLVATEACRDRFAPTGAIVIDRHQSECTTLTSEPASAPIQPDDGVLVVDRSTDPPTYQVDGASYWSTVRTCTHADGGVETDTVVDGAVWGMSSGSFERNVISGGAAEHGAGHEWRYLRSVP